MPPRRGSAAMAGGGVGDGCDAARSRSGSPRNCGTRIAATSRPATTAPPSTTGSSQRRGAADATLALRSIASERSSFALSSAIDVPCHPRSGSTRGALCAPEWSNFVTRLVSIAPATAFANASGFHAPFAFEIRLQLAPHFARPPSLLGDAPHEILHEDELRLHQRQPVFVLDDEDRRKLLPRQRRRQSLAGLRDRSDILSADLR